jgi:hypothetical protein
VRRSKVGFLALWLALLIGSAAATPIFTDSVDLVDCATPGTSCDDFMWATEAGSGADTVLYVVKMTGGDYTHNDQNGADSSSKWAIRVATGSNANRYYESPRLNTALALTTLSVHLRLHQDSFPASNGKVFLRIREADNTDGCAAKMRTDGKVELLYDAQVLNSGGTTDIVQPKACWVSTDRSSLLPCTTAATDCPSGYTCGNGSSACSTTDGAGCFWEGFVLTQENILFPGASGNGKVRCTLRLNGRKVAQAEQTPANKPATMNNVRVGNIEATAGAWSSWIDDIVIDTSSDSGHGWVGFASPSLDGDTTGTWTRNSCGTGAHVACIDDYGAQAYGVDYMSCGTTTTVKTESFRAASIPSPASGVSIGVVSAHMIARTSSATSRDMRDRIFVCENGSAAATCGTQAFTTNDDWFFTGDTTEKWVRSLYATSQPSAGGAVSWDGTALDKLGFEYKTNSAAGSPNNGVVRMHAAGLMAWFIRPADKAKPILRVHNYGTDTGRTSWAIVGHSNTGGTGGGVCSGGTAPAGTSCNQTDAASWSVEKDIPSGGCNGGHASVRTCLGRREEFNGGGGYPCGTCDVNGDCENGGTCTKTCAGENDGATCTTNGDCGTTGTCLGVCSTASSECPASGGTCSGDGNADGVKDGTCTQNVDIPCDVNADCNSLGGSCDTSATCVLSCGTGGICLGATGFGPIAAASVAADTVLICSQGGEPTSSLLTQRWLRVLQGIDPVCKAVVGSGVCGCSVSGDCPGGGTCTAGKCVGGSVCYGPKAIECKACSSDGDCGSLGNCVGLSGASVGHCACYFDPPSHILVHSGAADVVDIGEVPNCDNSGALVNTSTAVNAIEGLCERSACPLNSASDFCISDSEAQQSSRTPPDGSPSARCLGAKTTPGDNSYTCADGRQCTAYVPPCRQTSDCPAPSGNQMTCTTSDTGTDTVTSGWCQCSATNQCPTVVGSKFGCVNSACRMMCGNCSTSTNILCAENADCPGGQTCTNPLNSRCRFQGDATVTNVCTGSSPYVCKGRANCPCDRTTCSTDDQCPVRRFRNQGRDWRSSGICTAGRCKQCGFKTPSCPDSNYPHAQLNWESVMRHGQASVDDYVAMAKIVTDATETDGRPIIIPMSEAAFPGRGCVQTVDLEYLMRMWTQIRQSVTQIPRMIDLAPVLAGYPIEWALFESASGYKEYGVPLGLHYINAANVPAGGFASQTTVADVVSNYMNSMNTCAIGTCRSSVVTTGPACGTDSDCSGLAGTGKHCEFKKSAAKPQKYCRNPDLSWTSTTCTDSSGCTSPATCELRPCTCVCTQNSECSNWYGSTFSCKDGSNGSCGAGEACTCKKTDNTDACASAFGGGYACDAASAKCLSSGVDACPSSTDSCNPE